MGLVISNSYQSIQFGSELMGLMYQEAHTWSLDNPCAARFIGLGTATARAGLAIVARVMAIVEIAFKGIVNFFGSSCNNQCDFVNGCFQAIVLVPAATLALIFVVAEAALRLLVEIICVAVAPSASLQGARDQAAQDIRDLSQHCLWGDTFHHGLNLFVWNPLPPRANRFIQRANNPPPMAPLPPPAALPVPPQPVAAMPPVAVAPVQNIQVANNAPAIPAPFQPQIQAAVIPNVPVPANNAPPAPHPAQAAPVAVAMPPQPPALPDAVVVDNDVLEADTDTMQRYDIRALTMQRDNIRALLQGLLAHAATTPSRAAEPATPARSNGATLEEVD